MAKFMAYTQEQTNTIEYLINKGKTVNKKIQNALTKNDDAWADEEYQKLNGELDAVKAQLKEVLNARPAFDYHIAEAKKHIEAAEAISEKWGIKG